MNFENFKNLITETRCTRRFKQNITISTKELEEIIDTTRITSSAKNMQPLKYIVVSDKKIVDSLSKTATWAAHLTSWNQSEDERPSAFIILLNDKNIDGFAMVDLGISLQTIVLSSKLKGYATCPMASIDKELCKKEFKLSDNLEPLLGIAIGVADEKINLVAVKDNDTNYYRNNKDEHCVPKRRLDEVLIGSI